MSCVHFALSLFDLEKLDGFTEAWKAQDQAKVEEYLYNNGMDVSQLYDVVVCMHRTLCNKVEYGPRFEGAERVDPKWLSSGAASLDAHIAACPDVSKRVALQMLNPRGAISSWEDD